MRQSCTMIFFVLAIASLTTTCLSFLETASTSFGAESKSPTVAVSVPSTKKQGDNKVIPATSELFGKTKEGQNVTVWTLKNTNGTTAQILDFGGVLYSLEIVDRQGKFDNVSANLKTVPEYQANRPFFGSLVGRYGNRIAKGKFKLDGKTYSLPINNGKNALHGGLKGFDQVLWNVTPFERENGVGLKLEYTAKDGEEGYPGNLTVVVKYILTNDDELVIDYTATTDAPTVLNLTNHTFWNLAGSKGGSILNHKVHLGATHYLPTDATLIPTGEVLPVDGTPLDFRTPKTIGRDIAKVTQPQFNGGYDHCLVLEEKKPGELTFCAQVEDPKSGRTMEIWTTEPAVQFYTGNFLNGTTGIDGYQYEKHSAFCLETQHYPDSPNQPQFPNVVLRPGNVYRHTTIHKFSVNK
ncbi:MAG: galactose mutarotase [Thermoguttaceae bacterium]|nr:galactose mutarotase [Thermoguttaceae bacterium]